MAITNDALEPNVKDLDSINWAPAFISEKPPPTRADIKRLLKKHVRSV